MTEKEMIVILAREIRDLKNGMYPLRDIKEDLELDKLEHFALYENEE